MKKTFEDAVSFLRENDNYLIMQHRRPDGDAIGSSAGLCLGLRAMGKTAYVLPNAETTEKYLPYITGLYAPDGWTADKIVTVDTASVGMLQHEAAARGYEHSVDLAIDHHPSNEDYAATTYVRGEAAACGEIILDVLEALGADIDADTASVLYFAISTDTGCFSYGNTTAATLEAAARCIHYGAFNAKLNKIFHRTKSRKRILLEGRLMSGMDFYHNDQVVFICVTQAMINELGLTENDMDDIAGIPGQVEGVIVSVTMKEQKDGSTKISVRTTMDASANDICAPFGGGGHFMAAGCIINAGPEEAKRQLLESIENVMSK